MRAVLISIQPKWCKLIADGKKTIEVRKTKPDIKAPFKVYIYCTCKLSSDNSWQYKPSLYRDSRGFVRWIDVAFESIFKCEYLHQKIIGEFICDNIEEFCTLEDDSIHDIIDNSCLTIEDLSEYTRNKKAYGWHISNLIIYDKPRELSDFVGLRETKFGYEPVELIIPPQSWRYVRELE